MLTKGADFSGYDLDYSDTPVVVNDIGIVYAFLNIDMNQGYSPSMINNNEYYIIRWNGISIDKLDSTSNIVMEI